MDAAAGQEVKALAARSLAICSALPVADPYKIYRGFFDIGAKDKKIGEYKMEKEQKINQ